MSSKLVILEAMPAAADFYGLYWNKRPFVVPGAIAEDVIDDLIAADELAGLAMEDGPLSRMVKTAGADHDWSCRFGPFTEQDYKDAGDEDWSLLVQNVEQFHTDTASLLRYFNFAPRWLMDDIMVSYSGVGGSVGPHIDSYHVFLVQGQGRRRWKIGRQVVAQEVHIEGLDLKVLKGDFVGDEIEVGCGDVLYLPPKFAHQGTTLTPSLTFSVGFLGPKLSELLGGYANYLSEHEDLDRRYVGDGLDGDSAGFTLASGVVGNLSGNLVDQLQGIDFNRWLVQYFTEPGHEDFANEDEREDPLSTAAFKAELEQGGRLAKPEYIKFALTQVGPEKFYLGFNGQSFAFTQSQLSVIEELMKEQPVRFIESAEVMDHPATLEFLRTLYNHRGLELA